MDFDPGSWYRITFAGESGKSLAGTYPYMRGDIGLVTVTRTDPSTPSQQWQLFPIGASGYILRTQASGVHGYFAIIDSDGTCEGSKPVILNQPTVDHSMLWTVTSLNDGTFQLNNKVNGDDCTLDFSSADEILLSSATSNIGSPQMLSLAKLGKINDQAFLATTTPLATKLAFNAMYTMPTTLATSSSVGTITSIPTSSLISTSISTWHTKPTLSTALSSASPPLALPTALHASRLSLSAAMGIGIAVGIVGVVILLSLFLLFYRQYRLRYSRSSQHYRRAKLWKGFSPATPSTARTTFAETKMANIYFAELPTPATPAFMLSPPLENRASWHVDNRASVQSFGTIFPGSPRRGPIELPS